MIKLNTKSLPTKNNLIKIKRTIQQSKKGQMLLEQKAIILQKELEKCMAEEEKQRENFNEVFEEASHALKIANVEIGIEDMIDIASGIKVDNSIDIKYKTIMGVEIPSIVPEETEVKINYGLYNTTAKVDETILKYSKVKKYILETAQIENTVFELKRAIEKIQRRSNALKEIIIPEDEKIAEGIQEILDETEREEFIRRKKLKHYHNI